VHCSNYTSALHAANAQTNRNLRECPARTLLDLEHCFKQLSPVLVRLFPGKDATLQSACCLRSSLGMNNCCVPDQFAPHVLQPL
jgi:hypothetical protein